jgi:hypothetical protein
MSVGTTVLPGKPTNLDHLKLLLAMRHQLTEYLRSSLGLWNGRGHGLDISWTKARSSSLMLWTSELGAYGALEV